MFLNPVGISDATQGFAGIKNAFVEMVETYKDADSLVTLATLGPSVESICNLEYRVFETLVAGDIIKATRQASMEDYDALVIGCFYDPALEAARQIAGNMVVVGACQSSVETALRLANRYSVIIGHNGWKDQISEILRKYGYDSQLTSFRSINMSVPEMLENSADAEGRIFEQAKLAVEEDGAEAIVLGCTLKISLYQSIQRDLGVPVIDASIASLKTAELGAQMKARCGWGTSHKWGMQPPTEEELGRLPLFQTPYSFGVRVDVQ